MTLRAFVRPAALAAALLPLSAAAPPEVAAAEAVDQVFVSVPGDRRIRVIDRLTMQPAGTFDGDAVPTALAVTPDGTKLVAVAPVVVRLLVFDIATRSLLASPTLMSGDAELVDVVVSPDSLTAYVSTYQPARLVVVNLETYDEEDRVSVPNTGVYPGGRGLAITPDGTKVFFVDRDSNRLHMFDTATRTFTGDGAPIPAGAEEVAISGDGVWGIVVGENEPVFFLTSTGQVTSSEVDRGRHADVAVFGSFAYVTNLGTVGPPTKSGETGPRAAPVEGQAAIDVYYLGTGTHVASHALPEGTFPQGIAVFDGSHVYPCMEDDGTGHLLEFDGVEGTPGRTATSGGVPWRAVLHRTEGEPPPPPDETPVVSFFLPRAVNFVVKGPGKDVFSAAGAFDDGGLPADWAEPVKLTVGKYEREFTLVPNRKGTAYTFVDTGLKMKLTPRIRGSSKGKFRLQIRKTTLDGLVPTDDSVRLAFAATGLPDMAGAVKLTKGRYRIARRRGALVEPVMFAAFGKFRLGRTGDGTDSAVLRCGLATNGVTPAAIGQVRVGFGSFDTKIPGDAFVRSGDTFRATLVDGPERVVVSIDFLREIVKVTLKNVEIGPLAPGQVVDVVLDPGTGVGVCRNTVRLGAQGKRLFY